MINNPQYVPGDALSAPHFNELAQLVHALSNLHGEIPVVVDRGQGGFTIRYEANWRPAKWIFFTLTQTLAQTDASASCTVTQFALGYDPGPSTTVYNPPASANYMFAGVNGWKGVAVYDEINNEYWIVAMQPSLTARWINFTLPGTLATTDASKAGCTVNYYWDGSSPGATVTVYNQTASTNYMFSGAAGKHGLASYDPPTGKWWIVQIEC